MQNQVDPSPDTSCMNSFVAQMPYTHCTRAKAPDHKELGVVVGSSY